MTTKTFKRALALAMLALVAWSTAPAQEVCLTSTQYSAIHYDWTDANGTVHSEVPITQKATDPYQIYELLRTIYCDSRVPGPYYTAYDRNDNRENPTFYGANAGGWNIIATEPTASQLEEGYRMVTRPAQEGYTVLMVSLKNNCTPAYTDNRAHRFANKTQLMNYISNNIESVELLTEGLRLGQGEDRGTVYNITGTYNKFFFLSKGRARVNAVGYEVPFEDMFEQFSPTDGSTQLGSDYYQKLLAGEQYSVQHDCSSVMENKHYFTMSGETGTTYYSVDGLNFFIPDYRLKWESGTMANSGNYGNDTRTTKYQNLFIGHYAKYTTHLPSTMIYNINLTATRSNEVVNGQYTITLEWKSSLDEINGAPLNQMFYVYRYVIDPETGVRSRVLLDEIEGVYTQPTYGYKWVYTVPQEVSSYLMTYVVTGKPIDEGDASNSFKFRDTDSNDASVAIPGTDKLEALSLTIQGGYESVYNVNQEVNKYKNYVNLSEGLGTTKLTANHLNGTNWQAGNTTFQLYRYNNVSGDSVRVANLVVTKRYRTNWGSGYYTFNWEIDYNTASQRADASGYPTRSGSLDNVTNTSAPLDFGTIQFCDMFEASTAENNHPSQYSYRVYFDAAAALADNETQGHSNIIYVPVQKTELTLQGAQYTRNDVDEDDDHHLIKNDNNVAMSVAAHDDNILRYEIDRGTDSEKPVLNEPILGAQRLSSGTGYQPLVRQGNDLVEQGEEQYLFNGASVIDVPLTDVAEQDGVTTYVPVVRTYRPDGSQAQYNTYGAPIETFTLGKVLSIETVPDHVSGKDVEISEYTWRENGVTYCYYKVALEVTGLIPDDCEAVGFRVWRTCDKAHESALYIDPESDSYVERIKQRQDDALDPDKGYLVEKSLDGDYGDGTKPSVVFGQTVVTDKPEGVWIGDEWTGTFGAPMISHDGLDGSISELVVNYKARMYYRQKEQSGGGVHMPRRAEEQNKEYFVVEKDFSLKINSDNVITAVSLIKPENQPQSVTYYNTMGLPSVTPWQGVNIVVTRYTDGTTTTAKVVR